MNQIYKKLLSKNTAVNKINLYQQQFKLLDDKLQDLIERNKIIKN